ncbi:phage tail protein, partial [Salmonella enterica subsp. enterica serovar Senftenberg]|nr:phage tail protein [Salmonella enterica subsp. enterica serovar Senftenberg]
ARWKRTAMYWTMRQVGRGTYGKERNTVIDGNR